MRLFLGISPSVLTIIYQKIARAVEAEVARRLKEREEIARQEKENIVLQGKLREEEMMKEEDQRLPTGVLTQHRDLDAELRARLTELEEK